MVITGVELLDELLNSGVVVVDEWVILGRFSGGGVVKLLLKGRKKVAELFDFGGIGFWICLGNLAFWYGNKVFEKFGVTSVGVGKVVVRGDKLDASVTALFAFGRVGDELFDGAT